MSSNGDAGESMGPGAPAEYLRRIGIDPETVREPDLSTLAAIQRAHVRQVPFETLSITGDTRERFEPSGIALDLSTLYEKLVERGRGGYCFELNGLFCWLLGELGYDPRRIPARVLGESGDPGTPANHHSILVDLDQPYVVDVGLGTGKLTIPVPVESGTASGPLKEWRVRESDRPEETHRLEYNDGGWAGRYVFRDSAEPLSYFRATNDHLQAAEESPFTGDPFLSIATERGYITCSDRTLRRVEAGTEREQVLSEAEWYGHLTTTFNLPG